MIPRQPISKRTYTLFPYPPLFRSPAGCQRAFAIVLGFLFEFSRRGDVRHAVQLLLDHQADRLSIRNDGVALLRAVQSPALCLDGRDQLVENGTGADRKSTRLNSSH